MKMSVKSTIGDDAIICERKTGFYGLNRRKGAARNDSMICYIIGERATCNCCLCPDFKSAIQSVSITRK